MATISPTNASSPAHRTEPRPTPKTSSTSRIAIVVIGVFCVLAAVFGSLQPAAPLRPVQEVSPPPIFDTTANATFCGNEIVPTHWVHATQRTAFWHQYAIDRAIQAAPCDDSTKDRLIAALGRKCKYTHEENDEVLSELPQLSADKLKLNVYESRQMTVDPKDMTAPIMAGVHKKTYPPYNDHQEFIAVKVEDVETGQVETQVFNRLLTRNDHPEHIAVFESTWTTNNGPIIQGNGKHYSLKDEDVEILGHLFNGYAVEGREGHWYRLSC